MNIMEERPIDLVRGESLLDDEAARRFQDFMKQKRLEAGWTRQDDAARDIGVSQEVISRFERGFTDKITVGAFIRVVNAYHVSPNTAFEVLGLYTPIEDNSGIVELLEPLDEQERANVLDYLTVLVQGLISRRKK